MDEITGTPNNALTFPVQSLELFLEPIHQAADGGADGAQVEVSVDADRRPIGGLRRGRQHRQVLREVGQRQGSESKMEGSLGGYKVYSHKKKSTKYGLYGLNHLDGVQMHLIRSKRRGRFITEDVPDPEQ